MSEAEKRKRAEYRRNRKKWITVFIAAIALVSVLTLTFLGLYYNMSENTYVTYTESSDVAHRVNYKAGVDDGMKLDGVDRFHESYVSSVLANFVYQLNMDSEDISYEYSYYIDFTAELKTSMAQSAGTAWIFTEKLSESKKMTNEGSELVIRDSALIPFEKYHNIAMSEAEKMQAEGLYVIFTATMHVDVFSTCERFEGEGTRNSYSTAITLSPDASNSSFYKCDVIGSTQDEEKKIIACDKADTMLVFGGLTIGFLSADAALAIALIIFIYLTRNTDINYTIKVNKIVSSYRSYIQKIRGPFNAEGYQAVFVDSFREMLEIRDTIQSPILMSENDDRTMTRFIIPTPTKLLYIFEIKVADFDEIYSKTEEPVIEPDPWVYDYSFEASLALSDEEVRGYYSDIVAFAKSHGLKIARSWKRERIYLDKETYGVLVFKDDELSLALPGDPAAQSKKYGFTDMSESVRYKKTPCLMKITSEKAKNYATERLEALLAEREVQNELIECETEYVPYREKLLLIRLELIKTNNPEDLEAASLLEIEEPPVDDGEPKLLDMTGTGVDLEAVESALAEPDVDIETIDFVEESDPMVDVDNGVEVIGVVWPERAHRNKIYRYDPNGEVLHEGDIVLAPSRDVAKNKEIVRKVAVAHGNHRVDPESLHHPLKKIIGIVKRHTEAMLTPSDEKIEELLAKDAEAKKKDTED
ncbi:MAG: hypothetical protein IKB38_08180 [Clostridia bacterium]|nr:hypothetical protein [Clostridia bacterium]